MSLTTTLRYLDELGSAELDEDGSFAGYLDGKLIQSTEPPPDFVEPSWLSRPDVGWRWGYYDKAVHIAARTPPPTTLATLPPPLSPAAWLEIVAATKMHPERRKVAGALAGYASADGRDIWPSMGTLAKQLGKERARVNTHVSKLESAGLIARTGKGEHRGVIRYALTAPAPEVAHNQ